MMNLPKYKYKVLTGERIYLLFNCRIKKSLKEVSNLNEKVLFLTF